MAVEEGSNLLARAVGWLLRAVLVEFVLEVLVRGLGFAICRLVAPRVSPHDWVCVVVGLTGWLAILSGAYALLF